MRSMALACSTFAMLLCWISSAEATEDKPAARAHFQTGRRLYDLGEFQKALDEFKAAYVAKDDPVFLFNVAQCHRKLGHIDEAVSFYELFLKRAPTGDERRPWVEARLRKARDEVIFRQDLEPGDAATAAPSDKDPFAGEPPVASAGSAADPFAPNPKLAPARPTATSSSIPALPPAKAIVAMPVPTVEPGHSYRIAGIAAAGTGVASIAAGVYYYTRAAHYSDIVSRNPQHSVDDERAGENAETMQWVFYSVGAGALATGAVLYWLGWRESVRPSVGPGLAGLSTGGVF